MPADRKPAMTPNTMLSELLVDGTRWAGVLVSSALGVDVAVTVTVGVAVITRSGSREAVGEGVSRTGIVTGTFLSMKTISMPSDISWPLSLVKSIPRFPSVVTPEAIKLFSESVPSPSLNLSPGDQLFPSQIHSCKASDSCKARPSVALSDICTR